MKVGKVGPGNGFAANDADPLNTFGSELRGNGRCRYCRFGRSRVPRPYGRVGRAENASLTDTGIIGLARAIDEHGLPRLKRFFCETLRADAVKVLGCSGIAHAVINRCPQLELIDLAGSGIGMDNGIRRDAVMGMLEAAGRAAGDV